MRKKLNRIDILKAAFLYSKGWKQTDIGQKLGLPHQGRVSTAIQQAVSEGLLLRAAPTFQFQKLTSEERNGLEELIIETRTFTSQPVDFSQLIPQWRSRYEDSTVIEIKCLPYAPGENRHTTGTEDFYKEAADEMVAHITRSSTIGITWGTTLFHIISRLSTQRSGHGFSEKIFVPTVGAAFSTGLKAITISSRLSDKLHEFFNGDSKSRLSLDGVHAIRPYIKKHEEGLEERVKNERDSLIKQTFLDFLKDANPSYKTIFVEGQRGSKPLKEKLDVIFTSAGPIKKTGWKMGAERLPKAAGVDVETRRKLSMGDIGGVLLEKPGLDQNAKSRLNDINDRWTGLRLEDYLRVAREAANKKMSGIVVFCVGRDKSNVCFELLKRGLVNYLYCDLDLALQLKRKMEECLK